MRQFQHFRVPGVLYFLFHFRPHQYDGVFARRHDKIQELLYFPLFNIIFALKICFDQFSNLWFQRMRIMPGDAVVVKRIEINFHERVNVT